MPRRARPMIRHRPDGAATIFVLGLLGLLMCGALGIVAWVMSGGYEHRCRIAGVPPDSLATAGKILGIISTVALLAQIALILLLFGMFATVRVR
jgi:hypothetical protein